MDYSYMYVYFYIYIYIYMYMSGKLGDQGDSGLGCEMGDGFFITWEQNLLSFQAEDYICGAPC